MRTNTVDCCSIPLKHSTETSLYIKCCLNAPPPNPMCLLYIHNLFPCYIPVLKGKHPWTDFIMSFFLSWMIVLLWVIISNILSASSRSVMHWPYTSGWMKYPQGKTMWYTKRLWIESRNCSQGKASSGTKYLDLHTGGRQPPMCSANVCPCWL